MLVETSLWKPEYTGTKCSFMKFVSSVTLVSRSYGSRSYLSSQGRVSFTATMLPASNSRTQRTLCKVFSVGQHHCRLSPQSCHVTSIRCYCDLSLTHEPIGMSKCRETFSNRMATAGLKPHHRIALGVSGGPDSLALCVLAAEWKTSSLNTGGKHIDSMIDGLLAIIVDHGLRQESTDEANVVRNRVMAMGISCEIVHCDWSGGRPKQGHLQEAAREMRYQHFQNVCLKNQIDVLLVAHHADDQAELFILRLSRDSGILGLAGMPFTSQIFDGKLFLNDEFVVNHSILVVRPLLDLTKKDMYKICQEANLDWVEDPTNQNPSFARNRIRMSLSYLSSSMFKSELQSVIAACRKTRSYIDHISYKLINQVVVITNHGYAVIDLKKLNSLEIGDICVSKFTSLILQFVSQRHRPIRGGALKLLLHYFYTFPCKTSLTAAGCYLCPDPGSRGSRALVCCSVDGPVPANTELVQVCSYGEQEGSINDELDNIIVVGKSYADQLVPDSSEVHFLNVTSDGVLAEARRLDVVSESTYRNILSLQKEEIIRFKSKTKIASDCDLKSEIETVSDSLEKPLQAGKIYYFMNRFLVSWKLKDKVQAADTFSETASIDKGVVPECCSNHCLPCADHERELMVRCMIESDWLYLSKLSKCETPEKLPVESIILENRTDSGIMTNLYLEHGRVSAQNAFQLLKSIPVAARRSLPVLVTRQGQIISIPSIDFSQWPCLIAYAEFKPRVPLGGGHCSFT